MKRKLFYVSLVAILLVLQVLPVSAASVKIGNATMKATDVTARSGATVDVVLSLTGSTDKIDTLGVALTYDRGKLKLQSGEWLLGQDNTEIAQVETETDMAAWAGKSADTVRGDFLKLTFLVTEDTSVEQAVVEAAVTAKNGNVTVFDKAVTATISVENGVNLSGKCVSYGEGNAKVELFSSENPETALQTQEVLSNAGEYMFSTVDAGKYIIRVTKQKSAPREYEITVGEEDITQDVQICLYGDFDMNGAITAEDLTEVARYIGKLAQDVDDYQLALANVRVGGSSDGVGAEDLTDIARYIGKLLTEFQVCSGQE